MNARRVRDPAAGLTLIEVLVVLAVIGVAAGATVLGLAGGNRDAGAEAEARRLADRLRLATDEALVTGVPRALDWEPAGYRFLEWDAEAGAWRPDGQPLLGTPRALPAGLALDASADQAVVIAQDLAGPPVALTIVGARAAWRVAFDGFAVVAGPVAP